MTSLFGGRETRSKLLQTQRESELHRKLWIRDSNPGPTKQALTLTKSLLQLRFLHPIKLILVIVKCISGLAWSEFARSSHSKRKLRDKQIISVAVSTFFAAAGRSLSGQNLKWRVISWSYSPPSPNPRLWWNVVCHVILIMSHVHPLLSCLTVWTLYVLLSIYSLCCLAFWIQFWTIPERKAL